jgi:hypothetical protein
VDAAADAVVVDYLALRAQRKLDGLSEVVRSVREP